MKNLQKLGVRLLASAIALATMTFVAASPAAAQTGTLIFDEEFNGPAGSTPATPWAVVSGQAFWNNQCWATDPQHVSETGTGYLSLTATYSQTGNSCGDGNYDSGAIQIPASVWSYRYGKAEASIKVPCQSGTGLWPSFWQYTSQNLATGVIHKTSGEIDTMELMDNWSATSGATTTPQSPPPSGAGHYVSQSLHGNASNGSLFATSTVYNSDWCGAFHTFANTWTSTSVTFSVDGNTEATFNRSQLSPWTLTKPQAPVLSLLVGQYGGTPNSTTFPQTMLVDWVKIWSNG